MGFWQWEPLSEYEEEQVMKAIVAAEQNTSGEIRVHIDKWCKSNPIFKTQNLFTHLKMSETKRRNGVLIYIAKSEHKFAIVGDEGIHSVVGDGFWEEAKAKMLVHFENKNLVAGICAGIEEVGARLKEHFPYQSEDENELPDTISYGK